MRAYHQRVALPLLAAIAVAALATPTRVGAIPPDDWATFGHDDAHSGVSPDASPSTANASGLTLKWKTATGSSSGIVASPAVVYNATVGADVVYAATQAGSVVAINAATGAQVWSTKVGSTIRTSPAVAHNTVYVGSHDRHLYALDATTGKIVCSFTTTGQIESSPVVGAVDSTGDVVFFGDIGSGEKHNAGHEWAVNGVGNSRGNCTLKWSFNSFGVTSGGTRTGSWSSPALAQDATNRWLDVFGTTNPDDSVYALNAVTGAQVWRYNTTTVGDTDVGAGPSITAPGVNGFADGAVYVPGKNQVFYAIDLLKGTLYWSYNLKANAGSGAKSICTPAIVGVNVICPYNTFVYNLNAVTGKLTWRSPATTGGAYNASAAVSGPSGSEVIFAGDVGGVEHAWSLATGSPLFSYATGSMIFSSAAVVSSRVFFGAVDGSEYALG